MTPRSGLRCVSFNPSFCLASLLLVVFFGETVERAAKAVFLAVLAGRLISFLFETTASLFLAAKGARNAWSDLVNDYPVTTISLWRWRMAHMLFLQATVTNSPIWFKLERAKILSIFNALLAGTFLSGLNDQLASITYIATTLTRVEISCH